MAQRSRNTKSFQKHGWEVNIKKNLNQTFVYVQTRVGLMIVLSNAFQDVHDKPELWMHQISTV
jgi:hypothetical protein